MDAELDYDVLSIDTESLKALKYNFKHGLLKQLEQFADSPVHILQTDIVHREAARHVADEIGEHRGTINKAFALCKKFPEIAQSDIDNACQHLLLDASDMELAEARLNEFYNRINANVIHTKDFVSIETIVNSYFDTSPPFGHKQVKKHEFPDAMALLCLEKWGESNNAKILAVSKDKGWHEFAAQSSIIDVVTLLSEALAMLQPHTRVSEIIELAQSNSLFGNTASLTSQINSAIELSLDSADLDIEASSAYFFDYDDVTATLIDATPDMTNVNVIQISKDSVVLSIWTKVKCEVSANFDFTIRDSIDKDYIRIGDAHCAVESEYDTEVLVMLEGDFSRDNLDIEVTDIEVLETRPNLNMGDVEPNHDDDYFE